MKLLWVFDHLFYAAPDGSVYSRAHFKSELWNRYLSHFDSMTVAARERPPKDEQERENLVRSDRAEVSFSYLPSLTDPRTRFAAKREAKAILENLIEDADRVICRLPSESGKLAAKLCHQRNKTYALEIVGCAWDCHWNYGSLLGKLVAPFSWRGMRNATRKAPYALYVTRHWLQRRYPCEGLTEHASNVEIPSADPEALIDRLKRIETNTTTLRFGLIGYTGSRLKGIHIALKALALSKRKLPHFEFQVLGGGDYRLWEKLAENLGIGDQTTFLGLLPSGKPVRDWLDTVDIYLQPSFQEGLPRATIEAMSRACPVLGSTAGGIGELLDPGCLHKPGDYKTLAKQIKNLATDSQLRAKMAKENVDSSSQYETQFLSQRRSHFYQEFVTAKQP